jgi:RNA polymerase sigma-70 factor (ECF subfamily)
MKMTTAEFEIFARQNRGVMVTTARAILRSDDEAEDVVQEVLLKLFAIRDRIDSSTNPAALAKIAVRHAALNVLRDAKRHSSVELRYDSAAEEEVADHSERYNQLLRIIDTLPAKQQMVLRMKHIEGMEVEEIATAVQMSIYAVYQNLSRARRSVLQQFKKGANYEQER